MEPSSSTDVGSAESSLDYSFGFDNVNFSDRILLLEIIDELETKPNQGDKILDSATAAPTPPPPALPPLPRVKTIHINSLILAARSPFFRKLFSNGMRESKHRHVTLRIEAEEEVSFMDLLNYVYGNKLPTTPFPLLGLLKTADKFEVVSCLRDCSRSLQNLPMTCESASHYLKLPPTLLPSHTIQPLIDAAKQFLVAHFKDVGRFKEEVLDLPLAGIQAILQSDDLRVSSEGAVYDLVLMWARKNYGDLEERQGILSTHLLPLIRFPLMTTAKLIGEVLTCSDIDPTLVSKIVICALHFKAETPHRQRCLAAENDNAASHLFVERAYKFRPVKVIEFELTHQRCVTVYLDMKWKEVSHLFPDGHICSETFHLAGQEYCMVGQRILKKQTSIHFFMLLLVQVMGSTAHTVNYDIGLRMKPSEELGSISRGSHAFSEGPTGSIKELYAIPWTDLTAGGSPFFINGIVHVKAEFTIKK